MKKILITGTAGFIGFHLAKKLLENGVEVVGIDSFTAYYDVRMKEERNKVLLGFPAFKDFRESISNYDKLFTILEKEKPDFIIHLAAQAGVRYSLQNPWAYEDANSLGTLNIFEAAKNLGIKKVIYASSSSVYGANTKLPFSEDDRTDTPISLYAASKKANEVLAYSYHHLYKMDMIGLRFFTVYGEYNRPDMALFKFAWNMLSGKEIEVYNGGEMMRNFTYVGDIVDGILGIVEKNIAGYELYNLGGNESTPLMKYVEILEKYLGVEASIKMLPLQKGDVLKTVADISKAKRDFGFEPKTSLEDGIKKFADWFMKNKDWLLTLQEKTLS